MQSSIQFIDEEFGRPQAEERIKRGQMKPVASSLTAAESSAKRVLSECKTAGANMTYPADSRATPVWKAQRRTQYIGGYRIVEAAIKAAHRAFAERAHLFSGTTSSSKRSISALTCLVKMKRCFCASYH